MPARPTYIHFERMQTQFKLDVKSLLLQPLLLLLFFFFSLFFVFTFKRFPFFILHKYFGTCLKRRNSFFRINIICHAFCFGMDLFSSLVRLFFARRSWSCWCCNSLFCLVSLCLVESMIWDAHDIVVNVHAKPKPSFLCIFLQRSNLFAYWRIMEIWTRNEWCTQCTQSDTHSQTHTLAGKWLDWMPSKCYYQSITVKIDFCFRGQAITKNLFFRLLMITAHRWDIA